jgi:tetratricopeptide (TPR) repeat protein
LKVAKNLSIGRTIDRYYWFYSLGIFQLQEDSSFKLGQLGIAKVAKGNLDGAIADFTEVIKINPNYPEAYVNRGLVRFQQGLKSQAEQDFARSLAVKPSPKSFIETRVSQISLK